MLKKDSLKRFVQVAILSAAFVAPVAYSEADSIIDAKNPQAILELAKGFGYAELGTDSEGDPFINGRIDGTKYGIYFYRCSDEGDDCKDIQFMAYWSGVDISLEVVNRWNYTQRYGKACIDEDEDVRIEFPVNIDYGVTSDNLEDTIDWWAVTLREFRQFIDENTGD